ncbi:MAG: iron-sulfur cluster insertion protein ErpA [Deltaproteobacteria bacterium]|nr:iron-sulfur cluster insertion protein ErpA [Deltaproteobacteria bacterium]
MEATTEHTHTATETKPEGQSAEGTERSGLHLTTKAAEKVREIRQAEGLGEQGLRVRVIGGGCSGFSYDLFFEDEISDLDQKFESHGISMYVDMMSFQYLEGVEIDYVESLHGAGFKFQNPNAKSTCGCGSSFSA